MTDTELVEHARSAPDADLPRLIGRLAEAEAIAKRRLLAPAPAAAVEGKLLSIREAAERLGVSIHYLRRHKLPCERRIGRKVLYHSGELQGFIKQKR